MVELRIKEAAQLKGVKNYYQLGLRLDTKNTGDIKFEVLAKRLWGNRKANPTFNTLKAICVALDCDFGDLVVRVNGKKRKGK